MNCIERLKEFICACGSSHNDLKIKDFEELPDNEKYNYDFYDKDKDYLINCEKCNVYKILETEKL